MPYAALPQLPHEFHPDRPAVVILHYGDPRKTARLHRQLLDSDPLWRANIMVLDNAAPQPYPPEETWLRTAENLYWAGAFALCLDVCRKHGVGRLWFCNNDLFFTSRPPVLQTALARLQRLEQTLGPVALYSPAAESNPYHPQMVADSSSQARLLQIADGIAPLVSVEAVDTAGGLDATDNPYGYGVDLWLSLRLHRLGFPLVLDHQVTMKHTYHTTARSIEGFLEAAAASERDYLADRLGPDQRTIIQKAKAWRREINRL